MASTTALFAGLSGLSVNARRLDVIGNNIANVNTLGFKSSRMLLTPSFSRTLSTGTAPGQATGGVNPSQIGLGAKILGTQRNFNNGSISATGIPTDVAIEGHGFFVVDKGGEQLYTRAGALELSESSDLVTVDGSNIMGYGVDNQYQVVSGALQPLNIPVGTLTVAEASQNVFFRGNLNSSGTIGSTGSTHTNRTLFTDAALTTPLASAAFDLSVPGNDLYIDDGAGGSFLAIEGGAGTILTLNGAEKGGKEIAERSFAISATPVAGTDANGTTVQDYIDFLEASLGLDDSTIGGQTLGGSISFAAGVMTITGNEGTVQDLRLETANIIATNNGAGINQPFVMAKAGDADGESVRTSFVAYDSLGSPLTVDLTFVLQQTTPGVGTTWSFIAESADNDDVSQIVGLGTLEFDLNGEMVSASNQAFSIIRNNGAVTPLTVNMEFNDGADKVQALTTNASTLTATYQDGSPVGTLASFAITEDGRINGAFTNGLTRDLGQVALATFTNPEGLVDVGTNYFRVGPNSGNAVLATPGEFGTGRLIGGALELSNVDLSQEFIDMIMASTGYSAAGRVITTTDELIDQLMVMAR